MKYSFFWLTLIGAGAILARRGFLSVRAARATRSVPADSLGHYDLDGVSFDRAEGEVVVSGDAISHDAPVRPPGL
jgi:hypothetical protein